MKITVVVVCLSLSDLVLEVGELKGVFESVQYLSPVGDVVAGVFYS